MISKLKTCLVWCSVRMVRSASLSGSGVTDESTVGTGRTSAIVR